MTTYYLGFTSSGRPVGRKSRTDYGYTHAALNTEHAKTLPNFSTSAGGAARNFGKHFGTQPTHEIVEVQVVDAKTFNAAFEAAQAPTAAPAPVEPTKAAEPAPQPALKPSKFATREEWLQAFTDASREQFEAAGAPLPQEVRCSVGFPSKGLRSKVIGECWSNTASADGHAEIFIRPTLQSDTSRIADILTHELIHAALGNDEGHGKVFGRVARFLGLEGKLTATVAGDKWRLWADPILAKLGTFPGADLGAVELAGGKKKQTTRMIKLTCSECEFSCRTTRQHIRDEMSCPIPDCEGSLSSDQGEGDGE